MTTEQTQEIKKLKTSTISKKVLNKLVPGLDKDKVNDLYMSESGYAIPRVAKTKLIEKLNLSNENKKAVEEFMYSIKNKKNVNDMSANQLTSTIKSLNDQISKLQAEKKVFKDALDQKLK